MINPISLFILLARCEESVMLSPDEQQVVEQLRVQRVLHKGKGACSVLRLDGVLYFAPQHWTVWLNGRAYRFGDPWDQGRILRVEKNKVTLYIESLQQEVVLTLNQEIELSP